MDIGNTADLKTLSKRVESEQYYVTLEMFIADVKRMFANAKTYNSPETIYYKCSTRHGALILLVLILTFLFFFFSINSNFISACLGWKPIFKAKFKQVSKLVLKFSSSKFIELTCSALVILWRLFIMFRFV